MTLGWNRFLVLLQKRATSKIHSVQQNWRGYIIGFNKMDDQVKDVYTNLDTNKTDKIIKYCRLDKSELIYIFIFIESLRKIPTSCWLCLLNLGQFQQLYLGAYFSPILPNLRRWLCHGCTEIIVHIYNLLLILLSLSHTHTHTISQINFKLKNPALFWILGLFKYLPRTKQT